MDVSSRSNSALSWFLLGYHNTRLLDYLRAGQVCACAERCTSCSGVGSLGRDAREPWVVSVMAASKKWFAIRLALLGTIAVAALSVYVRESLVAARANRAV